ncbi:kinase-like domain-containing protein [Rhizophagus irregularis DAOM 181602=DAOM 197198]|nr:hypothetical protein RirG_082200 [Rhizophagus irregularis DAOM 197198w]GBC11712.1 kinase-like domain-containing protein [Rhizophagus irregularis DAOM 181602=DAOM 197198]
MQSKINTYNDIVFEWIPYNQFINIKEIGEGGFAKVYLAIWKDGPLQYNVKSYSIDNGGILKIYGISQNPDTKDYIIVLEYAKGGNLKNWMNKNYRNLNWYNKISMLLNISTGLKEIHQKKMVHHDFHTGIYYQILLVQLIVVVYFIFQIWDRTPNNT